MKIQIRMTGDKELAARLKRLAVESRKELRGVVRDLAGEKLEISQERVPYKSGKLHNTGRFGVRIGEKQVSARISYGGPDAPYAPRIHEDLEAKHSDGRQAKFLESVVLETKFGEEVAERFDLKRAARESA